MPSRDSIFVPEYEPTKFFAPRRSHYLIERSYAGVPPSWYDRWLYPTLADLEPDAPIPHTDWEMEEFQRGGWVR